MASRKKGWIGIDIGTRSVKLAQMERVGGGLRLCEAVVIQRRVPIAINDGEEPLSVTSEHEIRHALSLGKHFSGRKAACVLSMCSCDLKTMEVSLRNSSEQRLEIAGQLHSLSSGRDSGREFDFWQTDVPGEESRPNVESVAVLSVSQQWVAQVANDVAKAGLYCEAIDGLPPALARAVEMNTASSGREPVAVVDWGFARATFGVVINGRALFVRALNGCGLSRITQSLCETLGVSLDEAQQMLARHGVPDSPRSETAPDALQVATAEVAHDSLSTVVRELNRTLSFLKGQRPALVPRRIWLFGGGSSIKNVAGFLAPKIGLPVDAWGLENSGGQNQTANEYPSSILAPAISASSLAWIE